MVDKLRKVESMLLILMAGIERGSADKDAYTDVLEVAIDLLESMQTDLTREGAA